MRITQLKEEYLYKLDHLDIDLLISHVLEKTREFVLAHPEYILRKKQTAQIEKLLKRRILSEPIAYITGHKEFYNLKFQVNRYTLIPRPETELLVEKIIRKKPERAFIIDVGTGSGNIIISLAKNTDDSNYFLATDISKGALQVAKKNAYLHQMSKKIKFFHGNLIEPIWNQSRMRSKIQDKKISAIFIAANLPYLNIKIYQNTQPEIRDYEPKSALQSNQEGLAHYNKLFAQIRKAEKNIRVPVYLFMEISPEQKNKLKKIITLNWKHAKVFFHKDLSGKWRVCECAIFPKSNNSIA